MRIPYLIIGPAGFSLAILRGHDGLHENMPELADVPTIIEARDIETTIDTTPAASASISNTASSDYITRVCQNTDQDGPCAEIVDANECSILPDGVAHQVRNFYQASGWVCRYFDSTCNDPKGVITIDSHDGLYHVDLPPEAAAMIGMVVCAKNWFGAPPGAASEVQAKATITKAGASSTIKARGNEASVPGTIVLCQNTIDNGPCERVQAQNRCVAFGDATSHKVRSVYQPQGFNCNYFESDCSSHTAVVSITSHKQDTIVQLDPSVGGKIGLVLCQASRPIAELGVAYSSIEAHSGPVEARNNEIATSCPGDVRVCNTQGGAGACVRLRALNRCKRFPVGFAHQAEVVTQAAHSACTYYSENCESQHFSYEQQAGDQINELRGDLKIWGAVFCHEVPSPSARSIEAHQNDSQPASQPGDVTVCNKQQPCVYIHALNSCKHIYVDIFQPPEIIHQAGGVLCKYYRHTQCQAQYYLFEEISGEGDLAITGDVLHKILAVICMNADSAGLPEDATVDTAALFGSDNSGDRELDPPASNPLHTRNNDASHAPVQVRRSLGRMMIWDAPNFPSGHGTAGPYESCTNAPFTVKSLYIAKGSR
ncbi:hypothetical protein EJ02DRAFT_166591 [Clathrospora elynae]|uniref:Uncharacterized protein n=1 Tax=Clathrospora elynae TaxID=706981 RepID=A0A6A5SR44_9PLEO|nr:hypothetical protein EJ02DRAFT_166591 [Clathrospora elynae]